MTTNQGLIDDFHEVTVQYEAIFKTQIYIVHVADEPIHTGVQSCRRCESAILSAQGRYPNWPVGEFVCETLRWASTAVYKPTSFGSKPILAQGYVRVRLDSIDMRLVLESDRFNFCLSRRERRIQERYYADLEKRLQV